MRRVGASSWCCCRPGSREAAWPTIFSSHERCGAGLTVKPLAARARFVDDAYAARFGLQAFAQAIDVGLRRTDPAKQFDLAGAERIGDRDRVLVNVQADV